MAERKLCTLSIRFLQVIKNYYFGFINALLVTFRNIMMILLFFIILRRSEQAKDKLFHNFQIFRSFTAVFRIEESKEGTFTGIARA